MSVVGRLRLGRNVASREAERYVQGALRSLKEVKNEVPYLQRV